jgi:hypothetical protein
LPGRVETAKKVVQVGCHFNLLKISESKWQKTEKLTVNSREILFFERSGYEKHFDGGGVFPGGGGADI